MNEPEKKEESLQQKSLYRGSVVVFEDEENMCRILSKFLNVEGYHVTTFTRPVEGLAHVERFPPDVLITDMCMPGLDGLEVLKKVKSTDPNIVVLVITAFGSIDGAVDAMRGGAFHYIQKPFSLEELLAQLEKAMEQKHLIEENIARKQVQEIEYKDVGIIGESAAVKDVLNLIVRAGASDSAVLITGESGTGKELVARALHKNSPRSEKPFVAINCASIPESLLESELFGYERGAFTGADKTKLGLVEAATGGTLFLDEIGDLPLLLQAKILRVLQEKEIQRVGGTSTRRVDVRLIAATNQNLDRAIEQKKFREDLYYRLNVIRIRVPALRDREGDIPLLINHFLDRFSRRFSRERPEISTEASERLNGYPWPGNIRELENVMERLMILRDSDNISVDDLPPDIAGKSKDRAKVEETDEKSGRATDQFSDLDFRAAKNAFEREYLISLLRETDGNVVGAAKKAGISRRHLYEKIERLGIDTDEFRS